MPLTLASNLNPGPLMLSADVSWLECRINAFPAAPRSEAQLTVGNETTASADATAIESWKSKTPKPANDYSLNAWWEKWRATARVPLISAKQTITEKTGLYDPLDFSRRPTITMMFNLQRRLSAILPMISVCAKQLKKYSGDWPKEITGVFVMQAGTNRNGHAYRCR